MGNANSPVVLMAGVQWPPETFIQRLALGLTASGVRVQLAASGRARGDRGGGEMSFDVIDLPSGTAPFLGRVAEFLSAFLKKLMTHPVQLLRMMRRPGWRRMLPFVGLKPSVVHFQWNSAAIDYEDLFDVFPCPKVVSCRGSQVLVAPHNPKRRASMVAGLRRTLDRATRVHCVSDDIRREALMYGARAETAIVIRPAVDPGFFSPSPALGGESAAGCPLRIITVGALLWRKDHETALVAFSELVKSGVAATFDICGDGPGLQALEFTATDLEIAHLVNMRGRISPGDCRDALRRADVFLLSSVAEGISNAVLEAMACGLPVVATDCGGMREAVRDGIDGYLVPPRDADAMAAALGRLAGDGPGRRRMGASGRARVCDAFTLDRQVAEFRTLYNAAMGNAR